MIVTLIKIFIYLLYIHTYTHIQVIIWSNYSMTILWSNYDHDDESFHRVIICDL